MDRQCLFTEALDDLRWGVGVVEHQTVAESFAYWRARLGRKSIVHAPFSDEPVITA